MYQQNETKRPKAAFLEFAYWGQDIDSVLNTLACMAMEENWSYSNDTSRPFPILYNYLNHTFMRLSEQTKIVKNGGHLCFNTGLVTEHQQEIFAVFRETNGRVSFSRFCNEGDNVMGYYVPLPERATYFDDPADLIFDNRSEFRVNIDHIIGDEANFKRFPPDIQKLTKHQLVNTFNGAIEHAKKRIKRNYKTAIPQFYRGQYVPEGQLQLLLPLCLTDPGKADLALAVYKDKGHYSGRTCLTLDMAINNARLIAKPDDEWLRP